MFLNLSQRLQSLRMVAGLVAFLRHPQSLESVFKVASSLEHSPLATQMVRHLLAQPARAALVEENWRPPPLDLDTFEHLPEGTLGYAYAHPLRLLGFTPLQRIHPTDTSTPQA